MTLDDRLVTKLADHVKHGVAPAVAARAFDVRPTEWTDWLAKGREDEKADVVSVEAKLVRAMDKAGAEFRAAMNMALTKAAIGFRDQEGRHQEGDWHAAQIALDAAAGDQALEEIREMTTR